MSTTRKPINIVMADDDQEDYELTHAALEKARLANRLSWVKNGEELLQYLRKESPFENAPSPDIILLDLNMPRKDGREAIAEIRADPDLRIIPIIVLTTSNADADILKSYDLGVSSFITKPVTFEGLVEVVKTLDKYWFEIVKLPRGGCNIS